MLIAVTGGKGAPGVTVTALALALSWPRPVMLVEVDPRGGDLRYGYGQGVDTGGRGLLAWHLAGRGGVPDPGSVWAQVIALAETCWWMPGLDTPRQAGSVDWPAAAGALEVLPEVDVVADCGSVFAERAPRAVWQAAAGVLLVVRPSVVGVRAAVNAAELLRGDLIAGGLGPERMVAVLSGAGAPGAPYGPGEVRAELAPVPVLGRLGHDPRGAAALSGFRAARRRSRLLAQARALAGEVGARAESGFGQNPPGRPPGGPARPAMAPVVARADRRVPGPLVLPPRPAVRRAPPGAGAAPGAVSVFTVTATPPPPAPPPPGGEGSR